MGKTWSGPDRHKFGKRKTKRHRSRSKWSQKNGGRGNAPRLRSLAVDLAEFEQAGGTVQALPFPEEEKVPPKGSLKKEKKPKEKKPSRKSRFQKQLERDQGLVADTLANPLKGIGEERKKIYDALTTNELVERIDFYTRQCSFLTASARGAATHGDQKLAEKLRGEKGVFLIPEMNAIRLYLHRFR
jgi:hypothetical protein